MKFDVEGPFELKRDKLSIASDAANALIKDMEDHEEGLSQACGCYVFCLRNPKGLMPYYVGKTAKRTIPEELLNASNILKFNKLLRDKRGTPALFAIPLLTPNGKYRRSAKGKARIKEIDFLEKWLIMALIERNPEAINDKDTRFLRGIHIPGILNGKRGDSTQSSRDLHEALWPSKD